MKIYIYIISVSLFLMVSCTNSEGVEKYSSLNQYLKPGASVDIEYGNTEVDINTILNLTFYLITKIKSNEMNVQLKLTDKLKFYDKEKDNLNIKLEKNRIKYPISLKVISSKDGIHYINLLISLNNELRSFSIPIYVGDYKKIKQFKESNNKDYVIYKAVGTIIE